MKYLILFIFLAGELFANISEIQNTLKIRNKVGVNYYDVFVRYLKFKDESYEHGFKVLNRYKIPYIRINGSGIYFYKDWQNLYFNNEQEYFSKLDKVIKSAEKHKIKIIFTFFWRYTAVPRLFNEPISAYGDEKSQTTQFIKNYTKKVVERYKNSSAILGWEFGNEYNLKFNLPCKRLKKFFPNKRTWKKENILKLSDFNTIMKVFSQTIREYDKKYFISTGNSIPRTFIYGQVTRSNYISFLKNILLKENKYANTLSIHLYPWALRTRKYYQFFDNDIDDFIDFVEDVASSTGKKLFIGEFGFCKVPNHKKNLIFSKYLKAIADHHIKFSALWVFDRKFDKACNIKNIDLDILRRNNSNIHKINFLQNYNYPTLLFL